MNNELNAQSSNEETFVCKGWDDADQVLDESSSSRWVKLDDGQSQLLNIIGTPEVYTRQFREDSPPSTRFRVEIFNPATKGAQEWEMSKKVYEQLKRHRHRHADKMENAVFELSRKGTALKTEYFIDYVRQLDEDELEARHALVTPKKESPIPF